MQRSAKVILLLVTLGFSEHPTCLVPFLVTRALKNFGTHTRTYAHTHTRTHTHPPTHTPTHSPNHPPTHPPTHARPPARTRAQARARARAQAHAHSRARARALAQTCVTHLSLQCKCHYIACKAYTATYSTMCQRYLAWKLMQEVRPDSEQVSLKFCRSQRALPWKTAPLLRVDCTQLHVSHHFHHVGIACRALDLPSTTACH